MAAKSKYSMLPEPGEVRGLKEIPGEAWIIKIGNRHYIYSGPQSEKKEAVERLMYRTPRHLGRSAHVTKVVGG